MTTGKDLINSMNEVHDFIKKGKKIKGAKIHIPNAINVKRIREKIGMSQTMFAKHYAFNSRTLQEWEQGRRVPSENQQILLRLIDSNNDAVEKVLTHHSFA
jgi:putative transcriptional regulator